ncbi:MAG TPA: nitroreductase family protein [Prolixibacteraceae bacterium]|jgi:nitroreductase
MDFKDLVKNNRSYRRFDEQFVIKRETLVELIDLARFAASGRNAQSLKYFLSSERDLNEQIFLTLAWAGYLKEWPGPEKGERPSAYIIVLLDREISDHFLCDDGIAMQNILLGAVEKGLGGCILRAINKTLLSTILNLQERFEIIDVVALGKPIEKVVITNVGNDGDIRYYRDEDGIHYVPKRSLDELIINQ